MPTTGDTSVANGMQETLNLFMKYMTEFKPRPNVQIKDNVGNELSILSLDGQLLPPFGEEPVRNVKKYDVRDDDVILCGYPKTGCHWAWEVMGMISRRQATPSKLGKEILFMELSPTEVANSYPSPRVLNSHLWYDYLPTQALEKKTKLVFTVRNPKDTAVSYFHHHKKLVQHYGYKGGFHDWFPLFLEGKVDYGSYFDYHCTWAQDMKDNPDHPVMVISFEDMKEDLPRSVRRLAKFMGVSLDDQLVMDIATAAGFDNMKKAQTGGVARELLRKGQVGDWKNCLTVSESELIDEAVKSRLHGTIFGFPRYII